MTLTTAPHTVRVKCPVCSEPFDLAVTTSLVETGRGQDVFIRARLDHTAVDAHIISAHKVGLA